MSDNLFTLENINKAKLLFSPCSEDRGYLSAHSSAHWSIHQLSILSEDDIKQALDYLSVWDLVYEPLTTVTELAKVRSDVWQYCIVAPLSEGNKVIPLVGSCAVLGIVENKEIQLEKVLLVAGNFAFAILAKQQFDAEIINDFDNLDLKAKRQKAAHAKHNAFYGPIKAKMTEWAGQILSEHKEKMTMTALTNQVDTRYHGWLAKHPAGSIDYIKFHLFNKNQDADKAISWKTIYDWVTPLLRDKKAKPAK